MPLPASVILQLALTCAPTVAPGTLRAVVQVESGGDPLAIGVNVAHPQHWHPRDQAEAIRLASGLLARGANFDLGLGQINSRNLSPSRLTIADAFDPCRNLGASAQILAADYSQSEAGLSGEQAALRTSLSRYNTGDPEKGVRNGYVDRVAAASRRFVPELQPQTNSAVAPSPGPPAWNVFAVSASRLPSFVIHPPIYGDVP
jgi:type IV secretion system protein VirB1